MSDNLPIKAGAMAEELWHELDEAIRLIRKVGVTLPFFSDARRIDLIQLARTDAFLDELKTRISAEEAEKTFMENPR